MARAKRAGYLSMNCLFIDKPPSKIYYFRFARKVPLGCTEIISAAFTVTVNFKFDSKAFERFYFEFMWFSPQSVRTPVVRRQKGIMFFLPLCKPLPVDPPEIVLSGIIRKLSRGDIKAHADFLLNTISLTAGSILDCTSSISPSTSDKNENFCPPKYFSFVARNIS